MSFAYMPFYTGDYYRDTRHLSLLQHGAYRLLLDHCWDQRGPLPLDLDKCFRVCGAVSKEEQDAVRSVIAEFFVAMTDGHYNRRLQREIERCNAISGARSEAGKKGYEAKAKQMLSNCLANAKQLPLSPSPSPSLKKEDSRSYDLESPQAAPEGPEKGDHGVKNCPHRELLALWAEVLPAMPRHDPALWKGTRADHLRARWRETASARGWRDQADGLTYFRKLFAYIGKSAFLTGRESSNGKRPFIIELEWLVRPLNWAKVHEGKYHATVKESA